MSAPRVGLALIARDEAETLPRLLASIEGAFDRVVLLDTGSTDRTRNVFQVWATAQPDLTFSVGEFDWCDDFAAARAAADALLMYGTQQPHLLAMPRLVDWTCWADCDDEIHGAEHLRELAAQAPSELGGYVFGYDYAQDPAGDSVCYLKRERLVRAGHGHWGGRVHEAQAIDGPVTVVDPALVEWRHRKAPDRAGASADRNLRILTAWHDAEPENTRVLQYLGSEELGRGNPAKAADWFARYLDLEPEWDEERAQVHRKLALALMALGRAKDAVDVALRAMAVVPDWPDSYLSLAEAHLMLGEPRKAVWWARAALQRGAPDTMLIIAPRDYDAHPHGLLAYALAGTGDLDGALEHADLSLQLVQDEALAAAVAGWAGRRKADQVARTFAGCAELLVEHDEQAKALALLEGAVPHFAIDHPLVVDVRSRLREHVGPLLDPAGYARFYEREASKPEDFIADEHVAVVCEQVPRVQFLASALRETLAAELDSYWDGDRRLHRGCGREVLSLDDGDICGCGAQGNQRLRILDIGSHDGYIARWLADEFPNAVIDGIELHPPAVDAFNARMPAGRGVCKLGSAQGAADLFTPESYDAVVCFEVIEHVPDVGALLDACERMVRPGGLVFVSTPDGTFGAGGNRQHLRALRAIDLADLLRRRGRLVDMEVVGGVSTVAYRPCPRSADVAIYCGPGVPWSPVDIETKGLGGSETAAVRLAEQLSEIGWVVTVYGEVEACCFRDVIFRRWETFDPTERRQAVISSRTPEIFDRPVNAPHRLLWLHDTDCGDRLTPARADQIDHVLTLSDWHTGHVKRTYPFVRGKLVQARNGIEPSYFAGATPERNQKVAYTSSPDRGLDVLLELWPRVREQVPDAELHYCWTPPYDIVAEQVPAVAAHRRRIAELADQPGVIRRGNLTQPQVAQLLRESMVWCAPSWASLVDQPFHETSCIAAMEAQAAGALAVASNWGALSTTVQVGRLIDGPGLTDRWRDALVREIVDGLTNRKTQAWAQAEGPAAMADMGWRGVGIQVAAIIREVPELEEVA